MTSIKLKTHKIQPLCFSPADDRRVTVDHGSVGIVGHGALTERTQSGHIGLYGIPVISQGEYVEAAKAVGYRKRNEKEM